MSGWWLGVWLPIALMLGGIAGILIWSLIYQNKNYRRHSPPEQQQQEENEET